MENGTGTTANDAQRVHKARQPPPLQTSAMLLHAVAIAALCLLAIGPFFERWPLILPDVIPRLNFSFSIRFGFAYDDFAALEKNADVSGVTKDGQVRPCACSR
jgi:hypothetical protein